LVESVGKLKMKGLQLYERGVICKIFFHNFKNSYQEIWCTLASKKQKKQNVINMKIFKL
jgi:hypothetical protein